MSHASLKDQLQAVVSQFSETSENEQKVDNEKKLAPTVTVENEPRKDKERKFKKKHIQPENDKKAKPLWLEYVQYGVELLKVYFPACFKSANEVKPLKKGIKQDLLKQLSTRDEIVIADKACMVKSLAYYVNTILYHKNMVTGAIRIDLEGNPSGVVTAEEAQYSALRYQAKKERKYSSSQVATPAVKEEIA